jgi:8-oxo-dGTP diphosphatase
MPGPHCYEYPRPAVTVDLVAFRVRDGRLETLLIRRARDPFAGRWAIPGGFLDMDETAQAGARREFREETTLDPPTLVEFLGAFDAPDRDPRGRTISLAHVGLMPPGTPDPAGADDAAEAAWREVDALEPPELAFDHAAILEAARSRLAAILKEDDGRWLDLLDSPFDLDAVASTLRALGLPQGAESWLEAAVRAGRVVTLEGGRHRRKDGSAPPWRPA